MAITGRTEAECFDAFKEHMAALVSATITDRYPLLVKEDRSRTILGFRQGDPVAIPLDSRFGKVYLYLSQCLDAVPDDGKYVLKTRQYWYRIQEDPSPKAPALVRWEYDITIKRSRHARHHVHLPGAIPFDGGGRLDLGKAHLPTGWVTIEEVIRFLIVDLGIAPPCGDSWPNVLHDSEEKFFTDFTSKRYERAA